MLLRALEGSSSECTSWRRWSGRPTGSDGYQFGDITRGVLSSLPSRGSGSWKETSGRGSGSDGYQFGDVSRTLIRRASGVAGSVVSTAGAVLTNVGAAAGRRTEACRGARQDSFDGDIGDVWRMFFAQTCVFGVKSIEQEIISKDDVEAQEPYIFLGLPGLTLLELAIRSLNAEDGSMVLASGQILTRQCLPDGAGNAELFQAIVHATRALRKASLSEVQLTRLRHAVVRCEGTKCDSQDPQINRDSQDPQINRLAGMFQEMATDISQLDFFHKHFQEVLDGICEKQKKPGS